jgi:hypothetical protein
MEKGERPRDDLIIGLRRRAEIPTGGKKGRVQSPVLDHTRPLLRKRGGGYGGCDEKQAGRVR